MIPIIDEILVYFYCYPNTLGSIGSIDIFTAHLVCDAAPSGYKYQQELNAENVNCVK